MKPSWFGKPPRREEPIAHPGSGWPAALKTAQAELERWPAPDPDWEPLRQHLRELLAAAFAVPGAPVPTFDPEDEQTTFLLARIREAWREAVPAARVVMPALDQPRLLGRVRAINACSSAAEAVKQRLREVIEHDPVQLCHWAASLLRDGPETLLPRFQESGAGAEYAISSLRLALLAEIGDWTNRLLAQLPEAGWPHSFCPVCGSPPALAEWRGLEQRTFLRCDQCGAGWPGNRLDCPFCGQAGPEQIRTLFAAHDQQRCRLRACDGCGGRLKVLSTLTPLTPPGLIVAQFTMLYLDFVDDDEASRAASPASGGPEGPCRT